MGTCMSTCASSSQAEDENVQDKLVISQTPLPTFHPSKEISPSLSSPPSKQISPPKQITSSSPPSSLSTTPVTSAATTTTTSSNSSCCISTTTSSSALSCASSSRVRNDDGGEISRPPLKKKENARSSPTDRRIRERPCPTTKKNPRRFQKPNTKEEAPKLNVGTPQQANPRSCARSTSPSLSRQRSNRNETKEQYSSSVSHCRQNLASPSPCRSFLHVQRDPPKENPKKNGESSRSRSPFSGRRFLDGRSDVRSNPTKGRSRARRGGHSPSPSLSGGGRFSTDARSGHPPAENKWKTNCKKRATSNVAPRASRAKAGTMMEKENTRPPSNSASGSSTTTHGFCLEKGSQGDYDHATHGDAISKKLQDSSLPLEKDDDDDDRDIPLISLDCFIFL
ncbi:hypothetical protein ACLOJK_013992 [Asimina triloba]